MAKFGSSSMACLRKGMAARSPFSTRVYLLLTSLQGIQRGRRNLVEGTLNLRIEVSDSPNERRS